MQLRLLQLLKNSQIAPYKVSYLKTYLKLEQPLSKQLKSFVAIAAACLAFGTMVTWNGDGDAVGIRQGIYGVAMFPLFIGLAFLGLHYFANERKHR